MPKTHKNFLTLFLAVFFVSNSALAFDYADSYFDGSKINPRLVSPAPKEGSRVRKREVNKIIKLQKNPNLERLQQAFDETHSSPEIVLSAIDQDLSRKTHPKLFNMLDRVLSSAKEATRKSKTYWNVERPYKANKKINKLISSSGSPAYPSGHATAAYSISYISALLFPKYKTKLLKRAREIGDNRVFTGLHYPSDIRAGHQLSFFVIGGVMASKDFQKDFEKVKEEIQAANQSKK